MFKLTGIKKRWVFNSLSVVMLIVLLAVSAFSAAFSSYYYSSVQSGLVAKAKTATDFFSNYITQSPDSFYVSAVRYAQNFSDKNRMELQFINVRGGIITSSFGLTAGTSPGTDDISQALTTKEMSVWSGRDPETGERIMAVSSPLIYTNGELIGVMRYVTSLKTVDRQILFGILLAVAAGVSIILFVFFSNLYFIRSIVEPVTQITSTAKRIAAGSYGAQIEKTFDDEIGELADTINEMSRQIARSEKMQSEFISSVSHELRTPLTAISGWGETLLYDDGTDPAETKRGIVTMLKETNRLTKLVEDLLEFTRIQDGRIKLNVEETDIRAEFEDTVYIYGNQLRKENISLEYIDGGDVPNILCDGQRLKQVFLNILDNAAKHGREGRRITAYIGLEGDKVVTRIRDFGPGIPEEELPHIKLRFYKGSSKERGSGIGLAIAEEIVNLHNGRLIIENAEGGGTLVTIELPLN